MKTNFKRVACVMMSSFIMASGFGASKASAIWPFKSNPTKISLKNVEKIQKQVTRNNFEIMEKALNIFVKHKEYDELSPDEKKEICEFFKTALKNTNVFQFSYPEERTEGGFLESWTYTIGKACSQLANSDEERSNFISQVAGLLDAQHAQDNKINFPEDDSSPDAQRFYKHLYEKTKDVFISAIIKRTVELNKEQQGTAGIAKKALSHPLFILFAVSMTISNGADAFDSLRGLSIEFAHHIYDLYYKVTAKKFDLDNYSELLDRIETRLRAELVGQDEAIDRVIDIMRGYFQSMLEAKAQKKKFEGGLMLYLTGSPATGKSTMMKIIQEEMHLNNFEAKMSDIVEDKGNGAESVAARLTKPVVTKTKFTEIYDKTPLIRQLNQHNPTLYAFDEIDKMRKLDRQLQGKKTELGNIDSIDEILRNFIDTGHLAGVNASGSVLITTSNETDEDMMLLDSSLRNRYSQYRVKFRDFEKEDYKEIIRRGSVELQKHYADTFNTEIKWSENAMDYFATKFVEEQAGGRCAEPLMMKVRSAIAVLCKSTDIKNKILSINVSEGENKHVIIDVLGDAAVRDEQKTVNE